MTPCGVVVAFSTCQSLLRPPDAKIQEGMVERMISQTSGGVS